MAPRIPLDPALVDDYGVGDATGLVPSLTASRERMLAALGQLDRVDAVTHELCRLLNARLQQCQICLRYRYTDTDEALLGEADNYRESERLTERQKCALSLSDRYLRAPGEPAGPERDAWLAEFTPEEIIELLLRQFRYTWNKVMVAMALDGETRLTSAR
jgi:hypothetical protein